jgi:hypothetical protein
MVIQNNKHDLINVMEQSSVFKLPQFEVIVMKGLEFKT